MRPVALTLCCGVDASDTLQVTSISPGYKDDAVAVNLYKGFRVVPPETSRFVVVHWMPCGAVPPMMPTEGCAWYTAPASPAVPETKPHWVFDTVALRGSGSGSGGGGLCG